MHALIHQADTLLRAVRGHATTTPSRGAASLLIDAADALVWVVEALHRAERIADLDRPEPPREPAHDWTHGVVGEEAGERLADVLRTGTDG